MGKSVMESANPRQASAGRGPKKRGSDAVDVVGTHGGAEETVAAPQDPDVGMRGQLAHPAIEEQTAFIARVLASLAVAVDHGRKTSEGVVERDHGLRHAGRLEPHEHGVLGDAVAGAVRAQRAAKRDRVEQIAHRHPLDALALADRDPVVLADQEVVDHRRDVLDLPGDAAVGGSVDRHTATPRATHTSHEVMEGGEHHVGPLTAQDGHGHVRHVAVQGHVLELRGVQAEHNARAAPIPIVDEVADPADLAVAAVLDVGHGISRHADLSTEGAVDLAHRKTGNRLGAEQEGCGRAKTLAQSVETGTDVVRGAGQKHADFPWQ